VTCDKLRLLQPQAVCCLPSLLAKACLFSAGRKTLLPGCEPDLQTLSHPSGQRHSAGRKADSHLPQATWLLCEGGRNISGGHLKCLSQPYGVCTAGESVAHVEG